MTEKLIENPRSSLLSARDVARSVIADVQDFWMDGRGEDAEGMELGVHNADRILEALERSGLIIVKAANAA